MTISVANPSILPHVDRARIYFEVGNLYLFFFSFFFCRNERITLPNNIPRDFTRLRVVNAVTRDGNGEPNEYWKTNDAVDRMNKLLNYSLLSQATFYYNRL